MCVKTKTKQISYTHTQTHTQMDAQTNGKYSRFTRSPLHSHRHRRMRVSVCVPFIQRSFHPLAYYFQRANCYCRCCCCRCWLWLLLVQHSNLQIFCFKFQPHTLIRYHFIQRKQLLMEKLIYLKGFFGTFNALTEKQRISVKMIWFSIYSAIAFNQKNPQLLVWVLIDRRICLEVIERKRFD